MSARFSISCCSPTGIRVDELEAEDHRLSPEGPGEQTEQYTFGHIIVIIVNQKNLVVLTTIVTQY